MRGEIVVAHTKVMAQGTEGSTLEKSCPEDSVSGCVRACGVITAFCSAMVYSLQSSVIKPDHPFFCG